MDSVKDIVIFCAAAMLVGSLLPVRRLMMDLPHGAERRGWHWLSGLLVLMIGGFMAYAVGLNAHSNVAQELVIPGLLFFGSWFIFIVSQLSASGVQSARRLAELERQCITDGLTGIYNRRHFDTQLEIEQQRARRQGQPLALLLIDVDYFKRFNDQYGHQAGDEVLRAVSQQIQALSRSGDVVARYGGEEIAIIAPNTSLKQARIQAERLREAIAETEFALDEMAHSKAKVTVSIGISQAVEQDFANLDALLKRADQALYSAKSNGRNRVETLVERRTRSRVTDLRTWAAARRDNRAA